MGMHREKSRENNLSIGLWGGLTETNRAGKLVRTLKKRRL